MVLIGLLYNNFIGNMQNFPNHVIEVRKQDVSNLFSIVFKHHYSRINFNSSSTIDLNNLFSLSKPKCSNIWKNDKSNSILFRNISKKSDRY